MKKILTISLFLVSQCILGQTVQFSQYYSASLHLNPAVAGIYQEPSFHASHRRQISEKGTQVVNNLSQASVILPIKSKGRFQKMFGGVGAMAYREDAGVPGVYVTNGFFVNYAHNIYLGRLEGETIIVGAQLGYEQRNFQVSDLIWGSQYSPFVGTDITAPTPVSEFDDQVGYPIVNFGAMYYFNKERNFLLYRYSAFSGLVISNITRPNTAFVSSGDLARQRIVLKYHGGFEFKLEKFDFMPSILGTIETKKGNLFNNFQFNGGGTVAYSLQNEKRYTVSNRGTKLAAGAWYRLRDAFIFYIGFRSPVLNAGISYDMNSKLFFEDQNLPTVRPSFEVSVQYFMYQNTRSRRSGNPLF